MYAFIFFFIFIFFAFRMSVAVGNVTKMSKANKNTSWKNKGQPLRKWPLGTCKNKQFCLLISAANCPRPSRLTFSLLCPLKCLALGFVGNQYFLFGFGFISLHLFFFIFWVSAILTITLGNRTLSLWIWPQGLWEFSLARGPKDLQVLSALVLK